MRGIQNTKPSKTTSQTSAVNPRLSATVLIQNSTFLVLYSFEGEPIQAWHLFENIAFQINQIIFFKQKQFIYHELIKKKHLEVILKLMN